MSSYQPLADFLLSRKTDRWEASFAEIEHTIGRRLPESAYKYPAWWANQSGPGHSQTRGWKSAGWRTTQLDLERRRVIFERDRRPEKAQAGSGPADPSSGIDERLVAQAMLVSGNEDRAEVINLALGEYIRREAARGVAEMGGTAPGFKAAPRERPEA